MNSYLSSNSVYLTSSYSFIEPSKTQITQSNNTYQNSNAFGKQLIENYQKSLQKSFLKKNKKRSKKRVTHDNEINNNKSHNLSVINSNNKINNENTQNNVSSNDNKIKKSCSFVLEKPKITSNYEIQQSSLNSWIRQQGTTISEKPIKQSNTKKSTKKSVKFLNTTNIEASNVNINDTNGVEDNTLNNFTNNSAHSSADSSEGSNSNKYNDLLECPTPKPVKSFHSKCIEDIMKCNEPADLMLIDPKELVYIKKIPQLKLSIFGIGKSRSSLWQIKNTNMEDDSVLRFPRLIE